MARAVPTRTCIACGKQGDKRTLLRIVRSPRGAVSCDPSGKAPGRGAYVCLSEHCFDLVQKRGLLDSKLRMKVAPDDYERLACEMRSILADRAGRSDVEGGE
ncbi:MAG: YlxR family protein [Coriobacteriaceae bacterium]|nr:YlxR family protein [Coriobacteriaceae bacterium]